MVSLLAAGCGAKDESHPVQTGTPQTTAVETGTSGTATSESTTTTTAPVIPTWPLTGIPGDAAQMNIPIVVVKVDNSPWARPHAGINQADIVYELNVEGITRFMELYHSNSPDRIGPVRSARSS